MLMYVLVYQRIEIALIPCTDHLPDYHYGPSAGAAYVGPAIIIGNIYRAVNVCGVFYTQGWAGDEFESMGSRLSKN
jgi:hypothetical protein